MRPIEDKRETGGGRTNLFLHEGELLEVALQEGHLLLLRLGVAVTDHVVVLLLNLVELDLELDNLCTS